MIVFDDVCFSYGQRQIINNLSFAINFDEKVAILGGSGEGKTTILKLIMGLIKPDSGRIIIDGEDITDKTEEEMRSVRMKFSLVFQEGALFDSLSVKENVAFCLREYTKMSEEEIDRKVRELLRVVGVEHAMELMPEQLSGGMHRRVSIARSLSVCDPKMFLYDEPTSGLDPVNAENICKLILELSKGGKGFIIVTHKVVDALRVADRFMFLKDGELAFDDDREKLLHSNIPDIQVFLSELNYTGVKNV
ncbi:ABC transporter ATP-binding protein [Dissulfurispira thermophila]|uniref:ABC transporter ATP-binding protein n=1 Tax=Dissulfurispira thermophila TaxID=2715679 RepID=A0A7G1H2D7_9BACT|nr:ATP-binding cassette domain-containing protein [Dissulfurispira thermophila]BCB96975.1 ABC transporter ATP-binding protein [Dissulfurispira thermophila]